MGRQIDKALQAGL